MRRYTLVIPEEMWDEIERISKEKHQQVITTIKSALKLYLMLKNARGYRLFILKNDGTEREILLLD